jgi:hypothetical protein
MSHHIQHAHIWYRDGVQPHTVPSFSHSSHPDTPGVIEGVSEAIAAMECLAATTTAMVYMVSGQ